MANPTHIDILSKSVSGWNRWRQQSPEIKPDLRGADLRDKNFFWSEELSPANFAFADLSGADLSGSNLRGVTFQSAILEETYFHRANLIHANFTDADLTLADLSESDLGGATFVNAKINMARLTRADLTGANLTNAELMNSDLQDTNLRKATLKKANLEKANLIEANLRDSDCQQANFRDTQMCGAVLIRVNFQEADFTGSTIYGISAWKLKLEKSIQKNLVITDVGEPAVTVDDMEVAQFIHLLLSNEKIRNVIDTIASKVVLILGRFKPERKRILEVIRDELRKYNYLPVLFDFERPTSKSFIGTVSTLAHMARFVIADFTEPRIVLQEVQHIVSTLHVPVQPILLVGEQEPVELPDLRINHRSLMDTYRYRDGDGLLKSLCDEIIKPAEAKVVEIQRLTNQLLGV
jgi:uncharacterized protein YjbI with pentapeptide repeats